MREPRLVLGHNVALKAAVVQVKTDVFETKAVCGELLDRELKKVHIVRLLMDLAAAFEQLFVDIQKALVRKAVRSVGVFRERTAILINKKPGTMPGSLVSQF